MEILSAGPATREQLIEAGVPLPTINQALRTLREKRWAARCAAHAGRAGCAQALHGWTHDDSADKRKSEPPDPEQLRVIVRPMAGGAVAQSLIRRVDNLNIAPRNHGYLRTRHRLHNPSFKARRLRGAALTQTLSVIALRLSLALELVALLAAV